MTLVIEEGKFPKGSKWQTHGGWVAVVTLSDGAALMADHGPLHGGKWAHKADGTYAGARRDFDLISKWTDPAPEPAKVGLLDAQEFTTDILAIRVRASVTSTRRVRLEIGDREVTMRPERARALAAALTAYADQAEAAQ